MRVISGFLKGRVIKGYDINGTRPTMDRVKESVFAMIQDKLQNSICLDLFAGSGSLGIECISNGAKRCYFVDHNKNAVKVIKENITNFNINDQSIIILSDYHQAITNLINQNIKFDLIFLDPPYHDLIINSLLEIIAKSNLLTENGQVICEYEQDELNEKYSNLELIKSKKYGPKRINIYINK